MKENIFVKEKIKRLAIKKYLAEKLKTAGFIDAELSKSPIATRVIIYALKPGFVIGKGGSNIRALTEDIEKYFGLNKVHLEIGEIPNKDLDAKVIIENIANDIGRGVAWKSTVYRAMKQMKSAGAVGAEIVVKGNTAGKGQRKRSSRYYFGYLKKAGDQKNLVSFEKRTTFPGLGTIGIRLRIVHPGTVFSDKIDIKEIAHAFKIKREEKILEERSKEIETEEAKQKEKEVKKKEATSKKEKDVTSKKEIKTKEESDTKKETKKKASKKSEGKEVEEKEEVKE
jgi:small subunit ribosomal protein S3